MVLPEPTSPWSSRRMGTVRPRSRSISPMTRSCAPVGANGRPRRKPVGEVAGRRRAARARALPVLRAPAPQQGQLQEQQLLEGKAGPGLLGFAQVRGKVAGQNGLGPAGVTPPGEQSRRAAGRPG